MLRMAALLAGAATLASAGDGQLILRKHVASQPCVIQGVKSDCIVEGQETDIMYSVYNVGERCETRGRPARPAPCRPSAPPPLPHARSARSGS